MRSSEDGQGEQNVYNRSHPRQFGCASRYSERCFFEVRWIFASSSVPFTKETILPRGKAGIHRKVEIPAPRFLSGYLGTKRKQESSRRPWFPLDDVRADSSVRFQFVNTLNSGSEDDVCDHDCNGNWVDINVSKS